MLDAVTVGAENVALGDLSHQRVPRQMRGCAADGVLLLSRVAVVEVERRRMCKAAAGTLQRALVRTQTLSLFRVVLVLILVAFGSLVPTLRSLLRFTRLMLLGVSSPVLALILTSTG